MKGVDDEALRRVALYGTCEDCGQPRDVKVAALPDGGTQADLHCASCAQRPVSQLASREFGEVYMTWADDPEHGPRLRIAAAGRRAMITVPLLALIGAGESPWASLAETRLPGDGDPYGYRGSVLRIEADNRTVVYRIGEYLPRDRCYVAELHDQRPAEIMAE